MFSSHIWNKANAEKGRFYRYISNINTWKNAESKKLEHTNNDKTILTVKWNDSRTYV